MALQSKCCKNNALFSLGFAHGIYLNKENKYTGICGKCRKSAEFIKKTRKVVDTRKVFLFK